MRATRYFAVFIVAIFVTAMAVGQTSEGRILGTVSDPTGAVIPGAKISITNIKTEMTRQLVTTSDGTYVAPNLEPGMLHGHGRGARLQEGCQHAVCTRGFPRCSHRHETSDRCDHGDPASQRRGLPCRHDEYDSQRRAVEQSHRGAPCAGP